jgi:hypothetical protein
VSLSGLLEVLLKDTAWHEDAACRPKDGENLHSLFMPPTEDRQWTSERRRATRADIEKALVICQGCMARRQCAAYAEREKIRFGVWGGRLLGHASTLRKPSSFRPLRRSA